jgi:uroporphyrinogen-III synthase
VDESSSATALQGKRVIATRAVEQSRELVRALTDKGAVPLVLPMVAFAPPDDLAAFDRAIHDLPTHDWVFLTSQNALRALQERCQALGISLTAALGGTNLAAVGPATADAARLGGLNVSYVAKQHQGVALAEELAAKVKGKRVLLPRSDRANPELVDRLHELGATVNDVVAYKTVSPDDGAVREAKTMFERPVDAILFFSPSAVHHLQDILGNEKVLEMSRQAIFVAIGPITERALRAAGVGRALLAADTTAKSIVDTLERHFAAGRPGVSAGVKPA